MRGRERGGKAGGGGMATRARGLPGKKGSDSKWGGVQGVSFECVNVLVSHRHATNLEMQSQLVGASRHRPTLPKATQHKRCGKTQFINRN
jgi:hypothetical protein